MNIPDCPNCGSNHYQEGGSHLSPHLQQRSLVCLNCDALALVLAGAGQSVVTFLTYGEQYAVHQSGAGDLPPEYVEWANKVLLPTWRARHEQVEKHDNEEWRAWLAEVFYPKFPELRGQEGFSQMRQKLSVEEAGAIEIAMFGQE